ncbi:MAG TPA: PHP-associated domain-containing protein [Patescibacteria group bacterium]|nr:PHP-associated domain-containing protein [Patescibacteria group bacterium]
MLAVDLHTHSIASPDGSLTVDHYRRMLTTKHLDYIAITDHNRIDIAQQIQATLGSQIIIGEEITAVEGEVIGLFLREVVPKGLPLAETVRQIHAQGGLVYLPHPFETARKGVSAAALAPLVDQIDIVETHNGRAVFQNKSRQAETWATANNKPGAASSDAHGWHGWGKTYSMIDRTPTPETLASSLRAAQYRVRGPGLRGMLYPKYNRLRKMFTHV